MTAFDPTALRPNAPASPYDTHRDKEGLTARQHAAIALCVPDSGTPWLDAMIERRRLDEFAGKALAAMISASSSGTTFGVSYPKTNMNFAMASFEVGAAMLAASKKEPALAIKLNQAT